MNFYQSTRSTDQQASAKEAVLQGIAPDGGLYVLPELGKKQIDLNTILNQNYQENAVTILRELLPDYTQEELARCVANAYTDTFASPDVTPVRMVDGIPVLELFHGPTSAFKDVALTLLPQLMRTALQQQDKKALILTATSGDTGKAALSGFQDVDATGICVFYPHNKVSAIQYRQMATQQGNNVRVFAVEGNFDDAQSQVKKLFLDEELAAFAKEHGVSLSSANSINIGRLVPQIVYYFEAYKQLVKQGVISLGEEISFSVPTGNFGDVLAGYYASLLGLPVKTFYVASNANNVLTDFLREGVYDKNRPFIQTISPSMDILISSNLERLLYYMSGQDEQKVAGWMQDLAKTGRYELDDATKEKIQARFEGGCYDDEALKQTIAKTYEASGYVLDPHTAAGYALAKEKKGDSQEVIVALATASPYKFSQDVLKALGQEDLDEWQALHAQQNVNADPIPAPLAALESAEILHKDVLEIDAMKAAVKQAIQELFA